MQLAVGSGSRQWQLAVAVGSQQFAEDIFSEIWCSRLPKLSLCAGGQVSDLVAKKLDGQS